RLATERDWSAMEVCHLLLNLPLQQSTRQLRLMDCRPLEQQNLAAVLDEEGHIRSAKSDYKKYLDRSEEWRNLTFFEFLTSIDYSKPREWRRFPRATPRIINYFPRYK